ncbi:hypothetical protein [Delftia lacustris]|uniref:Uncharacterized protein n=1 Tax=Delftia lacustris TaxID=558537 RepID=A0A1H3SZS0_9BURK|nr:hypothetical protein [Delftia lacustris]SDZ43118.1 hypothetical protein SAMN05421547_12416 [Delftia lacustris]
MHGIAPYLVKVLDSENIQQDLWNINGTSLVNYLRDIYFKNILGVSKTTQEPASGQVGKNYILEEVFEASEHAVAGKFSTGEFGYEADIFDNEAKKYTGKREKQESTMLPFFCCFYAPKSENELERMKGVLLLSRFNNFGIRSVVLPDLIASFESAFPGLRLDIAKVVPTTFVNAVLKGSEIKKIRLTTNKLPEGYRNVLVPNDYDNVYEVETILKPRPRTFFSKPSWMSSLMYGVPLNTIITLPDAEVTKLKVEISRGGGRTRTINIADVHRMAANIEIENPDINARNHIKEECWMKEADLLADDYFLELGLNLPAWSNSVNVYKYPVEELPSLWEPSLRSA